MIKKPEILIPKKPHCFHQQDCPVVIQALNTQRNNDYKEMLEQILELEDEGMLAHEYEGYDASGKKCLPTCNACKLVKDLQSRFKDIERD